VLRAKPLAIFLQTDYKYLPFCAVFWRILGCHAYSKLYRDILVMCGTNPAFQILKTWIEERKLEGEDASGVLATLPAHLQTPSPDIVRQFYVSMSAASSGTHTDTQTPTALFGTATQGKTRQAKYVQRNIDVFSCNHRYRGKAISIIYSECVCL